MKTVFRRCFLVNVGVSADALQSLLPAPLTPDLHHGEAFVSIVIADMERMRPAFLPRVFGISYNQVVYRAMVRCNGERGVHFIRSDADNRLMCLGGNLMTYFKFHFSRMAFRTDGDKVRFDLTAPDGNQADIHAVFDMKGASRALPPTSRFTSMAQAQEFLVEQYAAYAPDPAAKTITRVRIKREPWNIVSVSDAGSDYPFLCRNPPFSPDRTRVDSVFYVEKIPYHWHRLERISHR